MHLLDLLFPRKCVGCGALGSYACERCCLRCPAIPHQKGILSLVEYHGAFEKMIKTAKYGNYEAVLKDVVRQLCHIHYEKILKQVAADVIIPVPLHKKRLRERGFNQSVIIAQEIGKISSVPVRTDIVVRTMYTQRLAGMHGAERTKHIAGVFTVVKPVPKSCLLVDDVYTTGSTLKELARTLNTQNISAFTLARRWYT